jgi:hypothetical protein
LRLMKVILDLFCGPLGKPVLDGNTESSCERARAGARVRETA